MSPPPEFEHEKRVEPLGMVGLLGFVFADEAVDGRAVEVGGGEGV